MGEKPRFLYPCTVQNNVTKTDERRIKLINKLRDELLDKKKSGIKLVRLDVIRNLNNSGFLKMIGYENSATAVENARKDSDPNIVEKLNLSPLPT